MKRSCLLNVDSEVMVTVSPKYFTSKIIDTPLLRFSQNSQFVDIVGQSATKAAVRACRNAIEFNSIPSVSRLVPNGYDGLKLDVLLAVPPRYRKSLDLSQVQEVFPYGSIRFQIQDGGMVAPSGIAIKELGDANEDMVVVCAAVSVGY